MLIQVPFKQMKHQGRTILDIVPNIKVWYIFSKEKQEYFSLEKYLQTIRKNIKSKKEFKENELS